MATLLVPRRQKRRWFQSRLDSKLLFSDINPSGCENRRLLLNTSYFNFLFTTVDKKETKHELRANVLFTYTYIFIFCMQASSVKFCRMFVTQLFCTLDVRASQKIKFSSSAEEPKIWQKTSQGKHFRTALFTIFPRARWLGYNRPCYLCCFLLIKISCRICLKVIIFPQGWALRFTCTIYLIVYYYDAVAPLQVNTQRYPDHSAGLKTLIKGKDDKNILKKFRPRGLPGSGSLTPDTHI